MIERTPSSDFEMWILQHLQPQIKWLTVQLQGCQPMLEALWECEGNGSGPKMYLR